MKAGLPILQFNDAAAFEAWLLDNPSSTGVWLKLAKGGGVATTLGKAEAIDCALCHGWIDGQIAAFDDVFFLTRFTPPTAKSRWSAANRARAQTLMDTGRVAPRGLAAIDAARPDGRWDAAYPSARRPRRPRTFEPRSMRAAALRKSSTRWTTPTATRCSTDCTVRPPAPVEPR